MAEVLYVVLAVLYCAVAMKLDEWQTISRLGMNWWVPKMYLLKPHMYDYTCWSLFWSAALLSIWFTRIPWWLGASLLVVLWFLSGVRGRIAAFQTYRRELAEMLQMEENEAIRADVIAKLRKSNSELLHDARLVAL